MLFTRHRRARREPGPWNRPRLLAMLVGAGLGAALLLTGAVLAGWYALSPQTTPTPTVVASSDLDGLSVQDRIAAEAMPSVDPQAAFSPDPATDTPGAVRVPAAIDAGPAGVMTGFPRTPEGALGQLAAIEQTVLESMSLPATRAVHADWVQSGGPSVESWELTRDVQSFLASGRQAGQTKDVTTQVVATPVAGIIKGTDGPSWAVVCVLMDVKASIQVDSRMGYGFCSRMQWQDGRWQVAAGEVPAQAPSAWPGSKAAVAAGWLTWEQEQ